jgi:6-phosphofructokinase 1
MSLSGMAVALKASTSSATQQQWWHPTRDQCQYGFTSLSKRKCRKRSMLLHVRAISGKLDLDFSDPSWKQKYQEDWDRRFSLPHITDIYDMEPRTTTFSLKKNRSSPVRYIFV